MFSSALAQPSTATLSYPTPTSRLLGAPQGKPCIFELSVATGLAWAGIYRGRLDSGLGAERAEKFREDRT